jgi:NitT/TauT family transport system substrate-binding protein
MIMSNGFQSLNYVRENLPFLTIASIMQKDPQILMTHEGNGINSFEDMRGRPILVGAAGRVTYWPFLRARFGFTDEQIRPYTFNVGPFLVDRMAIQQGFLSSEPFAAMEAGARPRVFLIADAGYETYQTTIDISRRMVEQRADLVQRFVNATIEGWSQYMTGQGIEAANALIKRDNPEMTDAKIAYAIRVMNERGIVLSGDAERLGIGAMTDERWERFYNGMRDAGRLPGGHGLPPRLLPAVREQARRPCLTAGACQGGRSSRSRASPSAMRTARWPCRAWTSRSGRGTSSRCSGRQAAASPPCCGWWRG